MPSPFNVGGRLIHTATILHNGWEMDNQGGIFEMPDGSIQAWTTNHGRPVPWSRDDVIAKISETEHSLALLRKALSLIPQGEAMNDDAQIQADITYLVEAYRYGQFSDSMLDHPSPSCRSPGQSVREALRRHLDWLESQQPTTKESS